MRIWKGVLFFFLSSLLFCDTPKHFKSETYLASKASEDLSFTWKESVDFSCQLNSARTLTFTFNRIQGQGHYQNETYQMDTQNPNDTHFDLIALKRFIGVPLEIHLDERGNILRPISDFQDLKKLTFQEHAFFNESLIEKLLTAVLSPKRYDSNYNLLTLPLYFPFDSSLTLAPNVSLQKKSLEVFFDQEVSLEGPYLVGETSFPLRVSGELLGEVQWDPGSCFSRYFQLSHLLDEKSLEPLFEAPLKFEYSLTVKQVCDE